MNENIILRIENLSKSMTDGDGTLIQLYQQVNMQLLEGQSIALIGPSGSGKSTLLAMVAGLEPVSEGEIWLFQQPISQLDDESLSRLRADYLGFVFQSFMLIPGFTAAENLQMARYIQGQSLTFSQARDVLAHVGLADKAGQDVACLSGGEQQRVALARAIVCQPRLLIADEPTGNLDPVTGQRISDLMFELNRDRQISLLLATHDEQLAKRCQNRYEIRQGGLYEC
ncbi:MAG: Lipoprotein-releasing system ATP-binding protein LolD [Candidatus Celerinatantimonas neptuna]|nr:MAG: Lipoprotein-releasing system ATP-binding protein LolD [Candidatus Celerinatantimonas neptuna]